MNVAVFLWTRGYRKSYWTDFFKNFTNLYFRIEPMQTSKTNPYFRKIRNIFQTVVCFKNLRDREVLLRKYVPVSAHVYFLSWLAFLSYFPRLSDPMTCTEKY